MAEVRTAETAHWYGEVDGREVRLYKLGADGGDTEPELAATIEKNEFSQLVLGLAERVVGVVNLCDRRPADDKPAADTFTSWAHSPDGKRRIMSPEHRREVKALAEEPEP